MKAIKIEFADTFTYARPLNFGQLEEAETLLKEINTDSVELSKGVVSDIPLDLLRKQLSIVLMGIRNYDPSFSREKDLTIQEITEAFMKVVSGSGLEEIPEGEAQPGR